MDHGVSAQRKWLLQVRSGERVVDDKDGAVVVGQLSYGGDIDHP